MRYRVLAGWVVGFALTAVVASVNCGGDDTTPGAAGSAGKGGTGGRGTTSTTATTSGTGGKATTATTTTTTTATTTTTGSGGTTGAGGAAGSAGSAGSGGSTDGGKSEGGTDAQPDGTTDAAPDSPTTVDARADAPDGSVFFGDVTAIFSAKCSGCHRPRDAGAQLLDLVTPAGLYDRLIAALPDNQEGRCGFPALDAGDEGGADASDAAVLPSRRPIVPRDPAASFLYAKVTGTQPTGCGVRMPRRNVTADDGGPAGSVGCDLADGGAAVNCLTQAELDTILHWIQQGAPNN
jgi:hypothetical protein